MLGFATIRKDGFPKESLDRERWRSLIGEFPELRRMEFLNVGTERYRVPDSAELVEDGTAIGAFIWEKGQIYVDGPYSMFPLAKGIADILDAGVFDDEGNEMLQQPEEPPRPTDERSVRFHQYGEPLDLTGKDLISRLARTKQEVATLVGDMLPSSQMETVQFPVQDLTSMTGEIADEVHEWPNARLGLEFRHLVLHFRNDSLIGFHWSHQARPASSSRPPWYRRLLGGKSA